MHIGPVPTKIFSSIIKSTCSKNPCENAGTLSTCRVAIKSSLRVATTSGHVSINVTIAAENSCFFASTKCAMLLFRSMYVRKLAVFTCAAFKSQYTAPNAGFIAA